MLFAVLFEDNSAADQDIRRQHMAAHLSFLEANAARIKAAGPLRTSQNDPAGGLWVVDAADPNIVDALVKADPFWPRGCAARSECCNGRRCSWMGSAWFDSGAARFAGRLDRALRKSGGAATMLGRPAIPPFRFRGTPGIVAFFAATMLRSCQEPRKVTRT
jgi:uncharacterized protein